MNILIPPAMQHLGGLRKQRGALLLLTLLILLVVSMLGMSSVDTTGLEMKMSSNSRDQREAFEAAEYTLSWVENALTTSGYFTDSAITNGGNGTPCGATCFSAAGVNGYYFNGDVSTATFPAVWNTCRLSPPVTEPHADSATWSTANRHRALAIPNSDIVAKYIVEYWCYSSSTGATLTALNAKRTYRITAYVVGEGGARVMLRSVVRQP
ncbi:MAG: hypothetical protein RLZZ227_2223 [Pseudomonadota bacterium]|jgi:type IV pilus assembly protein PilX